MDNTKVKHYLKSTYITCTYHALSCLLCANLVCKGSITFMDPEPNKKQYSPHFLDLRLVHLLHSHANMFFCL